MNAKGIFLNCKTQLRNKRRLHHVRFTPESGHVQCNYGCPLRANSGHQLVIANLAFCTIRKVCFGVRQRDVCAVSASPPIADINRGNRNVCFVPIADKRRRGWIVR